MTRRPSEGFRHRQVPTTHTGILLMLTAPEVKEHVLAQVSSFYGIDKLSLCLPEVDLQQILPNTPMSEDDKFSQTWDDWQKAYENHACKLWLEWNEDQNSDYPSWVMYRLSLLTLPRDLLLGAHKLVFGGVTDRPTHFAVAVLTAALFEVWGDPWCKGRHWLLGLYNSAKAEHARRLKLQADVDHLLAALEV